MPCICLLCRGRTHTLLPGSGGTQWKDAPDGAYSFAPPGRAVHRVWQTPAHGLGFSRQAKPLQIEGAKNYTHRLASFHPTRPADLLRPFWPTVEAAGDAQ